MKILCTFFFFFFKRDDFWVIKFIIILLSSSEKPFVTKGFLQLQKSNEKELKFLWDRCVKANAQCSELEAQKQAKIQAKVCNKRSA